MTKTSSDDLGQKLIWLGLQKEHGRWLAEHGITDDFVNICWHDKWSKNVILMLMMKSDEMDDFAMAWLKHRGKL